MSTVLPPHERAERSIPNYRQQIRRALPDQVFEADYSNLWWFPLHAAIIGGGLYVLSQHFHLGYAWLISLIVGHSFACLGFLAHDIAHGGSIKQLFARDSLAWIGFSWLGISPLLWRKWHNADHHNNTQIKGLDPDHLFTIDDYKDNAILKGLYLIHPLLRNLIIFGSFSFRMTQQQIRMLISYLRDRDTPGGEKAAMLAQSATQLAFWVALTLPFGLPVFLWGYVIPLMVGNAIAIAYIATNHFLNPLADERDVLATSLTVTLPGPIRFLDPWHQHFGAHVSHHLFPTVSGRHTRAVEEKAAELFPDRYHSMSIFKALRLLWDTPWVYETNQVLLDPVRDQRSPTLGNGLENRP